MCVRVCMRASARDAHIHTHTHTHTHTHVFAYHIHTYAGCIGRVEHLLGVNFYEAEEIAQGEKHLIIARCLLKKKSASQLHGASSMIICIVYRSTRTHKCVCERYYNKHTHSHTHTNKHARARAHTHTHTSHTHTGELYIYI